jgi:hypothetical protein
LPLLVSQVDTALPFDATELLFRRVNPSDVNSRGELTPSSLSSMSFNKDIVGCPSVLRSMFAMPHDAVHADCAGGHDQSSCYVFSIAVNALPGPIKTGDQRSISFHPVHHPLPSCGAHSVIASYLSDDLARKYLAPTRPVKNAFRTGLAINMKRVVEPKPEANTDAHDRKAV